MSVADDFMADAGVKQPAAKPQSASLTPMTDAEYAKYQAENPDIARVEIHGLEKPTPAASLADQFVADAKEGAPVVAAAPAAPAESGLSQLGHQLGLTARAGITGLASLPNMAGDALNGAINLGTSGINSLAGTHIPQLGLPSQATQNLLDAAGVSKPRNGMERGVQSAASAVAGVAPSVALGKVLAGTTKPMAQIIGNGLQADPGMQMVGAAGAGSGGAIAAENGAGIVGQLAAALLGGMTGVGAASGAKALAGRLSAPNAQQQLAQALRDQAGNNRPDTNAWPIPGGGPELPPASPASPPKPKLKLNVDGSIQDAPVPMGAPPGQPSSAPSQVAEFIPPRAPIEGKGLGSQRQLANIDLMKAIDLHEQRPSAISGNKFEAGIEFENGKLKNDVGQVARDQIDREQTALKGYAKKIIANTGAIADSPEEGGQIIRAPMQGLSDHFDSEVTKIYDASKKTAGELGAVEPKNLSRLMTDQNFRESLLSSPAGTSLLGSIERQVKRFQGVAIDGETLPDAPNTVNSAENLRKWLNAQWSPGNSRLIGQVKQAVDLDVGNAGGAGVFDQARELHALRRNTLDNPKGISKLLTIEGPNGINQAIPDENVASSLLKMPTGQFSHIIKTLQSLPSNLSEDGQRAIAEIKGALARKVYAAGDSGGTQNGASVWNAADVTRELNAQRSKMAILLTPDELKQFETLHAVGHVLQTPMAYKGAVAQGYNYLQTGAIAGLPAIGGGVGAYLGGPVGSMAGAGLGGAASMAAKAKIDGAMAQKLADQLRNPRPSFPAR